MPRNLSQWQKFLFRKEGLPEIHYCAIQSTKQIEEQGFRVRNGKHQYRLVELDTEGNLIPVALTKQNTMFFCPTGSRKTDS